MILYKVNDYIFILPKPIETWQFTILFPKGKWYNILNIFLNIKRI